eukprot:13053350-Alexandrium_andersonii.AAC.1
MRAVAMRALFATGQVGRCMDENHVCGGVDLQRATRRGLRCGCICKAGLAHLRGWRAMGVEACALRGARDWGPP